jgi:DNA-binding NtrC family response regulator
VEELRRRLDDRPGSRFQVIDVPESATIPIELGSQSSEPEQAPVIYRSGMTMTEVERAVIETVLHQCGGNRRQAATALGIGERTLYRKLKEFGLS